VPASVFAAQPKPAPAAPITKSICPMCGAQFNGDIKFCGECGAAVVPIN
jgi:predicted amidophosphoribosyltransferase